MIYVAFFLLGALAGMSVTHYFENKCINELVKLADQLNRSWERECHRLNDEWCDFFDNQ